MPRSMEATPASKPAMALRLGKLCGNGPDLWVNLQARYDLDRLSHEMGAELAAIPTLRAA